MTDEMLLTINRMIELCNSQPMRDGMESLRDMLCDFDEEYHVDENWLRGYLKGFVKMVRLPNYIETAIDARCAAANKFLENDKIISDFCNKNGISIDHINQDTESLLNPEDARKETLKQLRAVTRKT